MSNPKNTLTMDRASRRESFFGAVQTYPSPSQAGPRNMIPLGCSGNVSRMLPEFRLSSRTSRMFLVNRGGSNTIKSVVIAYRINVCFVMRY